MTFLAALAIAGLPGTVMHANDWSSDARTILTVLVPRPLDPDSGGRGTRLGAVQDRLTETPSIKSARVLSNDQLNQLLRPWLAISVTDIALPIPTVIAVHLNVAPREFGSLAVQLAEEASGTIVEDHSVWSGRPGKLAHAVRLYSIFVLATLAMLTVTIVGVATAFDLTTKWDLVQIVIQLGATDHYVARRFAGRAATSGWVAGAIGAMFALPIIFMLAAHTNQLGERGFSALGITGFLSNVPVTMWFIPVVLTLTAAIISFLTTYLVVSLWLYRQR